MKLKWSVMAAMAAVAAAALIGCGGQEKTAATTAAAGTETTAGEETAAGAATGAGKEAAAAGEKENQAVSSETLTVAIWDKNQEPGLTEIIKDFTAETGIKAQIQVTPWDQYWTMLEAGATGGSLPDVFWMHSNEIARYSEYEMLLDCQAFLKMSRKSLNISTNLFGAFCVFLCRFAISKSSTLIKGLYTTLWHVPDIGIISW